jgi:hypothetical protein
MDSREKYLKSCKETREIQEEGSRKRKISKDKINELIKKEDKNN